MMRHRFLPTILLLLMCTAVYAQQTPVRPRSPAKQPVLTAISPDLWRAEGDDPESAIHYVRLLLTGSVPGRDLKAPGEASSLDPTRPALIGQCTRDAQGKLRFELFANFGGVADHAFYPPWHSTGPNDLFPPRTEKLTLTMDFLGYTRVKPFKRQFEEVEAPGPGQLRYLNPGGGSTNMESPGWFFQYLRSLPTLRLTLLNHSADFVTTPWLSRLHAEPLCAVSGA